MNHERGTDPVDDLLERLRRARGDYVFTPQPAKAPSRPRGGEDYWSRVNKVITTAYEEGDSTFLQDTVAGKIPDRVREILGPEGVEAARKRAASFLGHLGVGADKIALLRSTAVDGEVIDSNSTLRIPRYVDNSETELIPRITQTDPDATQVIRHQDNRSHVPPIVSTTPPYDAEATMVIPTPVQGVRPQDARTEVINVQFLDPDATIRLYPPARSQP